MPREIFAFMPSSLGYPTLVPHFIALNWCRRGKRDDDSSAPSAFMGELLREMHMQERDGPAARERLKDFPRRGGSGRSGAPDPPARPAPHLHPAGTGTDRDRLPHFPFLSAITRAFSRVSGYAAVAVVCRQHYDFSALFVMPVALMR